MLKTLFPTLVLLASCQSQQPTVPPPNPANLSSAPGAVAIATLPLKLTTTPEGEKKYGFKVLELKDDGSVLKDGTPAGKITSDHTEQADGKVLSPIAKDGTVGNAKLGVDTLSDAAGDVLTINNDGSIMANTKGSEKKQLPASFEVFPSAGKHAALILLTMTPIGDVVLTLVR